jgi:hypothetical protein
MVPDGFYTNGAVEASDREGMGARSILDAGDEPSFQRGIPRGAARGGG